VHELALAFRIGSDARVERRAVLWNSERMKLEVGYCLLAWLVLPAWAGEKPSQVTVEGKSYAQIQDVHVVSGGRIVLLYPGGGMTVSSDKLSSAFMDAWGITAAQLDVSRKALERESEESLDQAIRAGLFREVDGVVYDLRKAQPGWVQFSNAKVLQVLEDGVLLDPAPKQPAATVIYVRNLTSRFLGDNDLISVMAKLTGRVNVGYLRTVRSYDVGRSCARNEIPEPVLKEGKSWAVLSSVLRPKDRPATLPQRDKLRAVGSGFFITQDGYLLTDFHVVENAQSIKVKCAGNLWDAEVMEVDKINDLAVVKISGTNFHALALSRRPSAQVGEPVFTIGFPNIDVQGLEPKYTDGKISSLSGLQDDPSQYQISVPVQPGNSGGPLCDTNGIVVGIVVAQLSDMALLRSSGSLPQNVNYAVKTGQALKLLQSLPQAALALEASEAGSTGPVQSVQDSVAMILVY
jgi:S1-C subfamily serine protease